MDQLQAQRNLQKKKSFRLPEFSAEPREVIESQRCKILINGDILKH